MLATIRRRLAALRSESGSLPASLGIVLVAGAFSAALIGAALYVADAATASRTTSVLNSAIDIRYATVAAAVQAGTAADGKECFPSLDTCVVATTATANGATTVTLSASFHDGYETLERVRTLSAVAGTHITGFDDAGNPIWGNAAATIPTRFTAVTSGPNRSCALDTAGKAWCAGANGIGDGQAGARSSFTQTAGGLTFTALATDTSSATGGTCGITASGIACWGPNAGNQLGTGAANPALAPTIVPGTAGYSRVAVSGGTICGTNAAGAILCWGQNGAKQVSRSNTATVITAPTTGLAGTYTELVADGTRWCAVTADAAITCWGSNDVPTTISGTLKLHELRVDGATTCALDTAGLAWCAGTGAGTPTNGQFAQVPAAPAFTALTVDDGARCGLTATQKLHCWGTNTDGRLGDGTTTARTSAVPVLAANSFTAVAMNAGTGCAIDTHRKLWCWGSNTGGRLGTGSASASNPTPAQVGGTARYTGVHVGASLFAFAQRGDLSGWGANTSGQLGTGATVNETAPKPAAVPSTPAVIAPFTGTNR